MEYVYHGSKVHNLKELTVHKSTHGTYVYATKRKEIAVIMSKRCGDDATYTFTINKDGTFDLIERIPHAFEKMYSNSSSLYTLDASYFKNIETSFDEVVSDKNVKVINEEYYESVYDEIKKMADMGLVNLYYFPERPDYIPSDDNDLVLKIRKYIDVLHRKYDERELSRWIFLHPNLENEIRLIAKELGISIPSYDEIKEIFIESQKENENHEMYIDNALEIYNYYNKTNIK